MCKGFFLWPLGGILCTWLWLGLMCDADLGTSGTDASTY